jgi:hypothetical protein
MRFDGWKLGCIEVWWLGGIYSPNHQKNRWWGLLSYGAPNSPVRQPRHQTVGFRPLELLTMGPLDSLVVHRTGPVHCPVRHLHLLWLLRAQLRTVAFHCSVADTVGMVDRCSAGHTGQSGATPDSPGNYSGAASPNSRRWQVWSWVPWCTGLSGGAPDIVWWHTGQSGALDQGCLWVVFFSFYLNPFLDFYWFVLNLWHL